MEPSTLPKRVIFPTKNVLFPPICPHCLKTAEFYAEISSKPELEGYYIYFTRWKYSKIRVPFCRQVAFLKRTLDWIFRFALVSFLIFSFLAGMFGWLGDGNSGILILCFPILGPVLIMQWLFRPENHIQILEGSDGFLEFGIEKESYAKAFSDLNSGRIEDWFKQ